MTQGFSPRSWAQIPGGGGWACEIIVNHDRRGMNNGKCPGKMAVIWLIRLDFAGIIGIVWGTRVTETGRLSHGFVSLYEMFCFGLWLQCSLLRHESCYGEISDQWGPFFVFIWKQKGLYICKSVIIVTDWLTCTISNDCFRWLIITDGFIAGKRRETTLYARWRSVPSVDEGGRAKDAAADTRRAVAVGPPFFNAKFVRKSKEDTSKKQLKLVICCSSLC